MEVESITVVVDQLSPPTGTSHSLSNDHFPTRQQTAENYTSPKTRDPMDHSLVQVPQDPSEMSSQRLSSFKDIPVSKLLSFNSELDRFPFDENMWEQICDFFSEPMTDDSLLERQETKDDYLEPPDNNTDDNTSLDARQDHTFNLLFESSYLDSYVVSQLPVDPTGELRCGEFILRKMCNSRPPTVVNFQPAAPKLREQNREIYKIIGRDGPKLMMLFFRHVNPFFPVFSRGRFYYSVHQDTNGFEFSLLSSMFSLALDWWTFDPELCMKDKPDVESLLEFTRSSITREMSQPRYGTLQACLLLSQKRPVNGDCSFVCSILSIGVALAQSKGLNVDCQDWDMPAWEKRIRRRLWWTLFVQEKWFSVLLGTPSHINKKDWDVSMITSNDFVHYPDPVVGKNTYLYSVRSFCTLVELTLIIDSIQDELLHLRSLRGPPIQVLNKATIFLDQIDSLHKNCPDFLKLENYEETSQISANGSLNLAFYTAKCIIWRTVLHRFRDCYSCEKSEVIRKFSVLKDTLTNEEVAAETLVLEKAVTHAEELVEFLSKLRPVHFESFWYSWSRYCFATISNFFLLLLVSATDDTQGSRIKSACSRLRWLFRSRLSQFCDLDLALGILDSLYAAGIMRLQGCPAA
ncbi:hypothetical protein KL925_004288 [Ogataea polymorpha]|nr:hypothetical protein KL925_004288 [Ogataea polymorpha]